MNNILTQFQQFMQNPAQYALMRSLPKDALQNPQAAVQQLMNEGKLSQQQFNQLQAQARQIMSNPMFAQMFGK